ncbi:MAG: arginine deiminase-related protein, partial [Pseudomonadota bacterium]
MVRPCRFASNPQTAATNSFQGLATAPDEETAQLAAVAEFDGLVAALRAAGITVVSVDDAPEPWTPDAIFPNNWFSTHADGRVVLYPMLAPNRRAERRHDIFTHLLPAAGFRVDRVVDLSAHEIHGGFLEGTGSLVLDRAQRIAYGCRSSRTHQEVADEFARTLG